MRILFPLKFCAGAVMETVPWYPMGYLQAWECKISNTMVTEGMGMVPAGIPQ